MLTMRKPEATGFSLSMLMVLVVMSAAIVPLCFPPYGIWPLLLPAMAALLLATTRTTARRAFYLGMLHGMLGYGLALYWFGFLFGAAALVLFAILALFTAGFCLLFNDLSRRTRSAHLKVLLAATVWTGFEFYRSELFYLRFPWITPGSAMGPTYLSPVVGVYGTTFLVVAAAAAFLHRRTVPLAVCLSLAVLLLGLYRPPPAESPEADAIAVALVQCEGGGLQQCVEMTRSAATDSPDLVVWPEYSLPYDVRQKEDNLAVLTGLCAEMDIVLVVGTKTSIGSGPTQWYNTALTIDESGVLGEYYKARPVHFFNDGIPGRNFTPINSDLGAIGTPICFDCDNSDVARCIVTRGAEFFAAPSLDPAPWSADQHRQHALLFRLRAAENGRWLVCAASSGLSQVVDPHGHVHASLPPLETGVVTGRIGRSRQLTFFTRAGWLLPWLTLACTAMLLGHAGIRFFAERQSRERDAGPGATQD